MIEIIILSVIIAYMLCGIRIVRPTHRAIIEFLGKYQKYGEPGFHWILLGIQKLHKIDITEYMVDAARQEIITNDNLNATVDAQVYFKVKANEESVKASQYNVYNYERQIVSLARTTLRNIIGTMSLKDANSKRGFINDELQQTLEKETDAWGIEIVRTELKEIEPPKDVQETMNKVVKAENEKISAVDYATAAETKADGEKRAAIKNAEGRRQAKILEAEAQKEFEILVAEGERQSQILKAEGRAESIKLVNEAADTYFVGNAQDLRKIEAIESSLKNNTKVIVPSNQKVVNVLGNLADLKIEKIKSDE